MPDNRIARVTPATKETDEQLNVPQPEVSEDAPIGQLGFTIDKKWRGVIIIAGVTITGAAGPLLATLSGTSLVVASCVLAGVGGLLAALGYKAKA